MKKHANLGLALWLTACQAPTSHAAPAPKASAAAVTTHPSATPAALALLQQPAGAVTLSGTLSMDGAYAFNSGQGSLISQDGGSLISQDAGTLISQDGGSIWMGGNSLISQDGGSIVAQAAGNLISKRKTYRLAAKNSLPQGTLLAAAGMAIELHELGTDRLLSLGTDAAGQPVLAVLTRAGGKFDVYPTERVPYRIVAHPPESSDQRLSYDYLPPDAGTLELGEDEALASRYLREAFGARLQRLFNDRHGRKFTDLIPDSVPAGLAPRMQEVGAEMDAALALRDATRFTQAQQRSVALNAADAILQGVVNTATDPADGKTPLLTAMVKELRTFRTKANATLNADPQHFNRAAYVQEANAALSDGQAPFDIQTASDLAEFCMAAYLSQPDRTKAGGIAVVYTDLGFDATAYTARINVLMGAILDLVGAELLADEEAVQRTVAAIKAGPTNGS